MKRYIGTHTAIQNTLEYSSIVLQTKLWFLAGLAMLMFFQGTANASTSFQVSLDAPISNVTVYVFNGSGGYLSLNALTDSSGQVTFDLDDGSYQFRADYQAKQFWSPAVTVPQDTSTNVTLGIQSVAVNLSDPIANVRVYAFTESGSYLNLYSDCDTNGQALFDLSLGSYTFRADYQTKQFWSSSIDTATTTTASIDLGIETITISLSEEVSNVRIYVFTGTGTYFNLYADSDAQGQTQFDLSTGQYKFRADYQEKQFWSDVICTPSQTTSSIDFGVVDVEVSLSEAISGIGIYAYTGGGVYLNLYGTSDSAGKVQFELSTGDYKFRADYQSSQYWSDEITTPADATSSISLGNSSVYVSLSAAIENVQVFAYSEAGQYLNLNALSNASGMVEFDLAAGSYKFRADHLGSQYWSPVISAPGQTETTVDLNMAMVTVSLSSAISNLTVWLYDGAGNSLGETASTNASGQAQFELSEGTYAFRSDYQLKSYYSSNVSTPTETTAAIDLGIQSVQVSLSATIEGVNVYVYTDSGDYFNTYGQTSAAGTVTFELAEGAYLFRADYLDSQYWSSAIDTSTSTNASIDLQIVDVTVSLGDSISGVPIFLYTESGDYLGIQNVTNGTGATTFSVSAGNYKFRGDYQSYQYWSLPIATPTDTSAYVPIDLQTFTVQLSLPVTGIPIYLFNGAGDYLSDYDYSDENGRVSFELAVGSFQFRADYLGSQYWSGTVVVPDQSDTVLDLDAALVTAKVIDDAGQGIEGVRVYLFSDDGTYLHVYSDTDPSGEAVFELSAGPYRFRADYQSKQYWSDTFMAAMATVNIQTHQVPVTVTLIPPLEGLPVYVFKDDGSTYLSIHGVTNADGQVFFDLAQGNVVFRADYLSRQLWSAVLSPPTEQTISLDLQLETATACVKKENGDPMTGVPAYLFTSTGSYLNRYGNVNSSGCWSVDVPPGDYKFRADRFGFQYWSDEFSAPTLDEVEIQTGVHTVEAQVVPPFSNATVYLFRTSTSYLGVSASTDTNGKASFELPIGSFLFRADYDGNQYWSETFEALGTTYVEIDTGLGECSEDADCETGEECQLGSCVLVAVCSQDAECDDDNSCTSDRCVSGQCEHTSLSDGVPCVADAFACTTSETCQSGVCVASEIDHTLCNDSNPCTEDLCDASTGCTYSNVSDGVVCAAEDTCREESVCQSGACVGTNKADGTFCADAFDCTTSETCQAGVCVAGSLNDLLCDDGNPCTDDFCLAESGCSSAPSTNGTACDDGNICTESDSCLGGSCSGGTPVADGSPCPDSNECTSSEQCWSGVCTVGILDHAACNDANPCTEDVCDASLGCTNENSADGLVCSDGNECTENSTCQSGQCLGANKPDGTNCTFDTIDCTINETCQGGVCTIGEFDHSSCSDSIADDCLVPQCVQGQGCQSDAANAPDGTACEDNDPCTIYTTCQSGACAGTQICGDEDGEDGDGQEVDVVEEDLSLSIDAPVANAFLNDPNGVVVSGTLSTSDGYESLLVNGTSATITAGAYFCEIDLTEGQNTILAVLTGSGGTTLSREVIVTVDSEDPQIVLSSPSMASLPATVLENPYQLQGIVIEDNLASLTMTTSEGIRHLSPIAGSFSSLVNLELGPNEFSITAVDRAGNTVSLTPDDGLILTLEQQAPTISISAPESGYVSSTATVDVVVLAQTATGHTLDQVSITRTNGGNQSVWTHGSEGEWTQAVTLLNGTNTIVARIQDTYSGQTYTSEASVIVQYLVETETDLNVLFVSPEANGTEIAVDEVFSLQFNKVCDRVSVDEKIRMETADGETIPLRIHMPEDSTLIGVSPASTLPYKTTVHLIAEGGLLAANGPGLPNSKQYQYVTEPPPTYIVGNVHDALMLPHAGVPLEIKGTSCSGTVGNTGSFRIRCEEEGVFEIHIKADKVNPPGHRIVKKIHLVKEQENDIGLTIIAPQFLDNLQSYDAQSDERQHLDFSNAIPGVFLDFPAKTLIFDEPGADTLCLSPIVQSMCPYAIEGLAELAIEQMYQVAPAPRLVGAETPAIFQFPNAYELSPGDPVLLVAGNRDTKKLAMIGIGQVKDSGSEIVFLVGTETLGRLEFLGVVPVTDEDGKADLNQIISDSFEDESLLEAVERILGSTDEEADGDVDGTETAALFPRLRNWINENIWQKLLTDLFISPAWAQVVSADPAIASLQAVVKSLGGGFMADSLVQMINYRFVAKGYVHTGAQYYGPMTNGQTWSDSLSASVPPNWINGNPISPPTNWTCPGYLEWLRFKDDGAQNANSLWLGKSYADIYNSAQDWCKDDTGLWMGPLPMPEVYLTVMPMLSSGMPEEIITSGDGYYFDTAKMAMFGSVDVLTTFVSRQISSTAFAHYDVNIAGENQKICFGVSVNPTVMVGISTASMPSVPFTNIPMSQRIVTGNVGFFPRPGTPYKYLTPHNGDPNITTVGDYYQATLKTRKGILWGIEDGTNSTTGYGYDFPTGDCEINPLSGPSDCGNWRTTYNATSQQLIHLGRNEQHMAGAPVTSDKSKTDDINQTEVYLFRYKALMNGSDTANALISSIPAVDLYYYQKAIVARENPIPCGNAGDFYKIIPQSTPEENLLWAAPYSFRLFQNLECQEAPTDSLGNVPEDFCTDALCERVDKKYCRFRSSYHGGYFNLILDNLDKTDFISHFLHNDYLKARISGNAVTQTMTISVHEPILALAINRSTGYVGARYWDPSRDAEDSGTTQNPVSPESQYSIGPINVPLFPPEIHFLVKRKPKSMPGGADKHYLVASQGVGNTKDQSVEIQVGWHIPVVKSFDCKAADTLGTCRLSKSEQNAISEKLASHFDHNTDWKINPYRASFVHRNPNKSNQEIIIDDDPSVTDTDSGRDAADTFSMANIRPGWQTIGLKLDNGQDFPVSTLSIRVNPWAIDTAKHPYITDVNKGFLAQYHQVAGKLVDYSNEIVDGDADIDMNGVRKRLEGWYNDDDPTWTSFGQVTCLTQQEYNEYKNRFNSEAGSNIDDYSMRWVEKFESKKSLPNDGLIDRPIVIEERGHLCWIKPCVDLLKDPTDVSTTCFGEEAAKEIEATLTDKSPMFAHNAVTMCKVCYTRESMLDIVSVEASGEPDGDVDDNVGIWAKEDGGTDGDADPERGSNMLTAGQSEGFLYGEPETLEIGLGEFIESHLATDDLSVVETGVHLYALQVYMPQSSGDAQSVYRLCIAYDDVNGTGGTDRLNCSVPCLAVRPSDRELIGGTCLEPGTQGTVPETFDFDLSPTNWDWSKVEDYVDIRLFEVGYWYSPLWEFRLYSPVNLVGYTREMLMDPESDTLPIGPSAEGRSGMYLSSNVNPTTYEKMYDFDAMPVRLEVRDLSQWEDIASRKLLIRLENHGHGGRVRAYASGGVGGGDCILTSDFVGNFDNNSAVACIQSRDANPVLSADNYEGSETIECSLDSSGAITSCDGGLTFEYVGNGSKQAAYLLMEGVGAGTIPRDVTLEIALANTDTSDCMPNYPPENPQYCLSARDDLSITPTEEDAELGWPDSSFQHEAGINLVNQNIVRGPYTDFSMDGPIPFSITRAYNSHDKTVGPLGAKWTLNVARQLFPEDHRGTGNGFDTRLVWTRPDGRKIRFTLDPNIHCTGEPTVCDYGALSPEMGFADQRYLGEGGVSLELVATTDVVLSKNGTADQKSYVIYDPTSGYAEFYEADRPPYRLRKIANVFDSEDLAIYITYNSEEKETDIGKWLKGDLTAQQKQSNEIASITIPHGGTDTLVLNFTYANGRLTGIETGGEELVDYSYSSLGYGTVNVADHLLTGVDLKNGLSFELKYGEPNATAFFSTNLSRIAKKLGNDTIDVEFIEYGASQIGGRAEKWQSFGAGRMLEKAVLLNGTTEDVYSPQSMLNGRFDVENEPVLSRKVILNPQSPQDRLEDDYFFAIGTRSRLPKSETHAGPLKGSIKTINSKAMVADKQDVVDPAAGNPCLMNEDMEEADFEQRRTCSVQPGETTASSHSGYGIKTTKASGNRRIDKLQTASVEISGNNGTDLMAVFDNQKVELADTGVPVLGAFGGLDARTLPLYQNQAGSNGGSTVTFGSGVESTNMDAHGDNPSRLGHVDWNSQWTPGDPQSSGTLSVSVDLPGSYEGKAYFGDITLPGPDLEIKGEDGNWPVEEVCMKSGVSDCTVYSNREPVLKRPRTITEPSDTKTAITYYGNGGGVETVMVTPFGSYGGNTVSHKMAYDAAGRLSQSFLGSEFGAVDTVTYHYPTFNSASGADSLTGSEASRTTYDNREWLNTTTLVNGADGLVDCTGPTSDADGFFAVTYEYNQAGMVISTRRDAATVSDSCPGGAEVYQAEYLEKYGDDYTSYRGTIMSVEHSMGFSTWYAYVPPGEGPQSGKLATVITGRNGQCSDESLDATCIKTAYEYDEQGRMSAVVSGGHTVKYEYDGLNRQVSMTPTGLAASKTEYDTDNGETLDRVKKAIEGYDIYVAEMDYNGPVERLDEIKWNGGTDTLFTVDSFGNGGPDHRLPIQTTFKSTVGSDPILVETDMARAYGSDTAAASGSFSRKRLWLSNLSGGAESSPYAPLGAGGDDDAATRSWLLADVYQGNTGYLYGRGRKQTPAVFADRTAALSLPNNNLDALAEQFRYAGTGYSTTESYSVSDTPPGFWPSGLFATGWTGRGADGNGTELFHPGLGGLQSYQTPSGLCVNLTHEQPWGRIVSMTVREPNGNGECDGTGAILFEQSVDYGEPCVAFNECGEVPGERVASESLSRQGATMQDWSYSYNATGRLKTASVGGISASYSYRGDGALTGVSANSGFPEATDTFTALSSSPYLFGSGNHTVSYDSHSGISTGRIDGFDGFTFTYDKRGRLATATDGNVTARYDYDVDGWRVLKRVKNEADGTSELTRYVYSGTNLVAERIERANCISGTCATSEREERRYIWLGMRPAAMIRRICDDISGLDWATCTADYEYYDIVTERRGAPVMVVAADRSIVWSGAYSPYGVLYGETGSLKMNLRLPGQYEDTETGFYYNGLRYYIPEMGRYNRPEPIGQAGSLDLFTYAGGDPINKGDVTGLREDMMHDIITTTDVEAADEGLQQLKENVQDRIVEMGAECEGDACKIMMGGVYVASEFLPESSAELAMSLPVAGAAAGKLTSMGGKAVKKLVKKAGKLGEVVDDAVEAGLKKADVGDLPDKLPEGAGVCFVAGTEVELCDGEKMAIEDIESGDEVKTWNLESGSVTCRKVVKTFERTTEELLFIHIAGEIIQTTSEHPFWVEGQGWTGAGELEGGDCLRGVSSGDCVQVEGTERVGISVPVYNFEVAVDHNYFVGETGLLVHNSCKKAAPPKKDVSSRAARRDAMRKEGIPTSQQPTSQTKNASGREYQYEVPKEGGGTKTKSVQQQTLDESHPGEPHWEAGDVKVDDRTGEIQMNQYGRPKLKSDKSKVNYDDQ